MKSAGKPKRKKEKETLHEGIQLEKE